MDDMAIGQSGYKTKENEAQGTAIKGAASNSEKAMVRLSDRSRRRAKVLIAMFFAVVFGAFGDISLSRGMKEIGAMHHKSFSAAFIAGVTNPFVVGGTLLLIGFLLLYLASLSWEDLSYVLPLTAADYVLVTLLAYFLLHESVSPERWAGSVLVAAGIAAVTKS